MVRRRQLHHLRGREHLEAVPAGLLRLHLRHRLVSPDHLLRELRQVHHVPHEAPATVVVAPEVSEQEGLLRLLCCLLLHLRLLLIYLLRLLVLIPRESHFLSSLCVSIFISFFLFGLLLGFAGVPPGSQSRLELPLLFLLIVLAVQQGATATHASRT